MSLVIDEQRAEAMLAWDQDPGGLSETIDGIPVQAIELQDRGCRWLTCGRRTGYCDGDHLVAWQLGGATNPENGDLLCGPHNRLRQTGFRLWRDPSGRWHHYRPDGSEIH